MAGRPSVALAFAAAVVLLCSGGCGYSLAGRGSFLPAYIRTIGVPTFENNTPIFNLETEITQKVRSEFIGRGRYQIVPDTTNVDALLTGAVTGVEVQAAGFTDQQIASSFVVTLRARVELRDMTADRVLWENQRLVFRQEYQAQTGNNVFDPAAVFAQDAPAYDRITTDFARTVVSSILEAF
jgi:hypothetical protein